MAYPAPGPGERPPVWRRLLLALVLAAMAAAGAAGGPPRGPAAVCPVGGTTGRWVRGRGGFSWVRDQACAYRASTREAVLRLLAGKHVALVGDSTTRLMAWELAMWGWGCGVDKNAKVARSSFPARFAEGAFSLPTRGGLRRFPRGLGQLCNYGHELGRWDRTPWTTVIPGGPAPSARDVTVTWRWCPYMWDAREATLALLRSPAPPDVVIVNNGFWHLRHAPRPCDGECAAGPRYGLLNATAAFLDALGGLPPRLSARVVWRGFNHITQAPDRDFSNAGIDELEGALGDAWGGAGFPVVPIAGYTPASETLERVFTEEGYHPRRWVYRLLMGEVLDAALDAMQAAAEEGEAEAGGGDDDGGGGGGGGGGGEGGPSGGASPSASPTRRASRSASRSPRRTPSRTRTASPPPTRSGSASSTPPPSPTSEPSESMEPSPSGAAASRRPTRSPSRSGSRAPTPSPAGTPTASPSPSAGGEDDDGAAGDDDDYTAHAGGGGDGPGDIGAAEIAGATHDVVTAAGLEPLLEGRRSALAAVGPHVGALVVAAVAGAGVALRHRRGRALQVAPGAQ